MQSRATTQLLFSYGTLRQANVQLEIFNQELTGFDAIITDYILQDLQILDQDVIAKSGKDIHQIMIYTGNVKDEIKGMVFALTPAQLEIADKYEVEDYQRIEVKLKGGGKAFAYAARQ